MFARKLAYPAAYTHRSPSRDAEALRLVRWLSDKPGTLVVVALQMSNYHNARFLDRLGLARAPRLAKRTVRDLYQHNPAKVLALWPTAELLGEIDASHVVEAVAVLPWTLEEIDAWRHARQAVDLLGEVPTPAAPTIADAAVRGAMIELTNAVNMSAPLSHPSDHDRIVSAFRTLHRTGHRWTKAEVERWALANGWRRHDVDELIDKGTRIASGRVVRLKSRSGREWNDDNAVYRWVERAQEDH